MTNPTPRPALRKAEDSDVHPAAPQPARRPRTPRATGAAPAAAAGRTTSSSTAGAAPAAAAGRTTKSAAPAKAPSTRAARTKAPAEAAPVEVVAVVEAVEAAPKPAKAKRYATPPAVPVKKKRERTGFSGTTSDHLRRTDAPAAAAAEKSAKAAKKRRKADAALMAAPLVTVKVKLPKKLRKAAEKEAARRGLDLDAVTAELLHTWLTHRP